MKPRRLEQAQPFYEPVKGTMSHPSSAIDVKVPYMDDAPSSERPYEDTTNTDRKPSSICTDELNVIN